MVAYCPEGYPDEDFRSILFRYKSRLGATNYLTSRELSYQLFGVRSEICGVLPRNLCNFIVRTSSALSPHDIIYRHTLYPVFHPFATPVFERLMYTGMMYNHENIVPNRHISTIHIHFVKFCPECLVSDISEYGDSYIHRVHQFEFVQVCPKHQVYLLKQCPTCEQPLADYRRFRYMPTNCCPHCSSILPSVYVEENEETSFLLNIAFDCEDLLRSNEHPRHLTKLKYDSLFFMKGYLKDGIYLNECLYKDLIQFYKFENMSLVNLSAKYLGRRLASNIAEMRNTNPLAHILIMRFLLGSCKNFLSYEVPALYSPVYWGHGPWECINPLCPKYKERIITTCNKHTTGKALLYATFVCPICCCAYMINAGSETTRIIDRGSLFKEKVISAENSPEKLRQIEKVISNRISQSQISSINMESQKEELKVRRAKERIMYLVNENKNLERNDVSEQIGYAAFNFVYDRDPHWIDAILPKKEYAPVKLKLEEEDERISKLIREIAIDLKHINYFRRIRQSTIINRLSVRDRSVLRLHREKLIETQRSLDESIEPVESYQIRRIPITINYLLRHKKTVTLANFFNCTPYKNCSSKVVEHINISIDQMYTQEDE